MQIKNVDKLVAVSGLPGLFHLEATRNDGLILKDFTTNKVNFVPARKHQFTPIKSIAIYTYGDSTPLEDIIQSIHTLKGETDLTALAKASNADVLKWFRTILPEYDEDRVYHSDVRKVIKWYSFLNLHDLISNEAPVQEENIISGEEE